MPALELVKEDSFGAVKCDFFQDEQDEVYMTIDQLSDALGYASKDGVKKILQRNDYLRNEEFSTRYRLSLVEGNREVTRERIVFTEDGIYEVTMLASNSEQARKFRKWVREVIKEIRKTGSYSAGADTIEDLIIMQAQSMKELKQQVQAQQEEIASTKEELTATKHRVDNLDNLDTDGDLRDKLNKMIQRYAFDIGGQFKQAWREFKQNFNTAYDTNIKLIQTNEEKKAGKELSLPAVLERRGLLEDAIRVADKMLN